MTAQSQAKFVKEIVYQVGENKVVLLEGNIVHVTAIGPQDKKTACIHMEMHEEFLKICGSKLNYLIDLNRAGKNSPEARNIWLKISEKESTNKIALIGVHAVARVLAVFVMVVSRRGNMRFFENEQEGMRWIKE